MKTLTIAQPWAWAIATGHKSVENRSWRTRYRGPLLIHAAQSTNRLHYSHLFANLPENLDFGAIIAEVQLVDCIPASECHLPFAEGPWCWIFRNPRRIMPIPCRGQLSLWDASTVLRKMGSPSTISDNPQAISLAIREARQD